MGSHARTRRHGTTGLQAGDALFLKANGYSRVPQIVQWMATLRCGMSCPHCLSDSGPKAAADMSIGLACDLVDQVADMGVDEFLVTGGEPLAREDLTGVIEHLAERGVGWSLDTARMPSKGQRRALATCPPTFVAVSLDGPPEVHNSFRGSPDAFEGAMRSIRYFAELGCHVAAGTTVTTANKEGRATGRPDLFLSKQQLAGLLRFVATKNKYFPVTMADEFGYCGDWEPLVRDLPMTCGAGRTQCVVLPDGSVVPCTTLDRSTSAGNLHRSTLREIWENGFADLRRHAASGRCVKCEYAIACKGGCWLQRRGGTQCYREIWHVPAALKTAAGVAVCLGAMVTGGTSCSVDPKVARVETAVERAGGGIEGWIVLLHGSRLGLINSDGWYAADDRRREMRENRLREEIEAGPKGELANDPAGAYLVRLAKGELPADIRGRAAAVTECLGTQQRSLALAALLWRDLSEACLDGPNPGKRSAAERAAIRDAMGKLRHAAFTWRKEIFDGKLDPYLERGREFIQYVHSCSKANRPRAAWIRLTQDLGVERWGGARKRDQRTGRPMQKEALEGFLERHPYAEHMLLKLTVTGPGVAILGAEGERPCRGEEPFGIHDLLLVEGDDVDAVVRSPHREFAARLPARTELTYVDLLALVDEKNPGAASLLREDPSYVYHTQRSHRWYLYEPDPLLLPAVRRLERELTKARGQTRKPDYKKDALLWQARRWLVDFWMF